MNIRRYVYDTIKPPPEQPKFVKTLICSHKFCSELPQTGGEHSKRALLPLVLTIHHNNKDPLNACMCALKMKRHQYFMLHINRSSTASGNRHVSRMCLHVQSHQQTHPLTHNIMLFLKAILILAS